MWFEHIFFLLWPNGFFGRQSVVSVVFWVHTITLTKVFNCIRKQSQKQTVIFPPSLFIKNANCSFLIMSSCHVWLCSFLFRFGSLLEITVLYLLYYLVKQLTKQVGLLMFALWYEIFLIRTLVTALNFKGHDFLFTQSAEFLDYCACEILTQE